MKQDVLFSLAPYTVPSPAPIWERRVVGSSALGHKANVWLHVPSGAEVWHCGHPTANYPYFILLADGTRILAPNGRGFMRLELAKQHTEELWSSR